MQPYDNFVEKFSKKVLDREINETIYELYFKNSTAKSIDAIIYTMYMIQT